MRRVSVLIVGGGPAGYTAALYAARAKLEPLLVSDSAPGGQLMGTTLVENYPGFAKGILGPDLMRAMDQQCRNVGVEMANDTIETVDFSERPFRCVGQAATYLADSVILATGAHPRWLGLESETAFCGYGVSSCATCDAFFFRDEDVAVVGGGNTAAEEALFLARTAKSVTLIHRRDTLRADKTLQERLFSNPKVRFVWNAEVVEVLGDADPKSVTGLAVRDVETLKTENIKCSALFVAIGHVPNTAFLKGHLEMDAQGYLCNPLSVLTEIPGVFAAGDLKDQRYRQAITAAGQGCMAAFEAERFLTI